MAKRQISVGSTSEVWEIFLQDSGSAVGAGKTGILYNAAGLSCYYKRNKGSASVSVTLADIPTLGTFVSGGFKQVDGTNMPGVYEFHPPDAALASGAQSVTFFFQGASGMAVLPLEVELVAVNLQDGVRFGLTALPNVASGSAGAIPTTGTGANQINVSGGRADADAKYWNGTAVATPDTAGYPKITIKSGTGTGEISLASGRANADVVYWNAAAVATPDTAGYPKVTLKVGTGTGEISLASGRANADVVYWNAAAVATPDAAGYPKVTHKVGTGTGEVDLVSGQVKASLEKILGTALTEGAAGRLTAAFKQFFDLATPTSTMNLITAVTTVTNLTNAATSGDLTATMKASLLTTALTESYAADGSTPTLAQFLYMIWSMLAEKSISTTTLTCKKLDGTTNAMTFTLSDATNPVSITRAT